jgi:hypothetical protein
VALLQRAQDESFSHSLMFKKDFFFSSQTTIMQKSNSPIRLPPFTRDFHPSLQENPQKPHPWEWTIQFIP